MRNINFLLSKGFSSSDLCKTMNMFIDFEVFIILKTFPFSVYIQPTVGCIYTEKENVLSIINTSKSMNIFIVLNKSEDEKLWIMRN